MTFYQRNTPKYHSKQNRQWQIKSLSFDCEMSVDKSLIFLNCLLKRNHIVKCIGYITLCYICTIKTPHFELSLHPSNFHCCFLFSYCGWNYYLYEGIIIWKEYFHIEMTNCPNMSQYNYSILKEIKAIKTVLLLLNKRTSTTLTVQLEKACNWVFPRKNFDD